ncbi:MAG: 2-amino-4-hydroxy-6-hydroxymethyldihydropteridine diphosphokinase [Hyphomonadaceae bacterium]|nr:2-amino-4-hydroxy-6-hydroxymethyldihydropteridine diphosphokinase [Hyphomonadaceae bacterium]
MPIYVALGANQNSVFNGQSHTPVETFQLLFKELADGGINVINVSGLWESPAWPDPKTQPAYNNAVIEISTDLRPVSLLQVLKTLEYSFGRREGIRNAPRPLDLDILDYHGLTLNRAGLTLPHPRMCDRPFVLFPLCEIAPEWRDPIKNRAIDNWIARLELSEVTPMKRLGKML